MSTAYEQAAFRNRLRVAAAAPKIPTKPPGPSAAEQAAAASVSVGAMMKLVSPVMLRQVEVFCMTAAEHAIAAGAE